MRVEVTAKIKGVKYFETYMPVLNWQTVSTIILLVMNLLLQLSTKKGDYMAAFVHADIDQEPQWDTMTEAEWLGEEPSIYEYAERIPTSGMYAETD